jgi:hypothetical protein
MISTDVLGSRLPVGSSASSTSGRLTHARAIETRCCSPPDSSSGKLLSLSPSPTRSRISGTRWSMMCLGLPITSRANPTFSNTVLSCRSLKSWNTVPMLRRRYGTFHGESLARCLPATKICPLETSSSLRSSRMNVDLPEPEVPTMKTNSPFSMSTVTSSRAVTPFR